MIDVGALVTSMLILGMFLVFADILRGACGGQWPAPRQPRQPLKFEFHVLASAIVLWVGVPIVMGMLVVGPSSGLLKRLEAQTLSNLVVIAVLIPILAASTTNRLADYGVNFRGWRDEARYGGVGFLASIPPVLAVVLLTMSLRSEETQHPFLKLLKEGPTDRSIVEITIAAAIVTPLAEELFFRVVLQGLLEPLVSPLLAILGPAVVFAAVHPPQDMLPLLPLAIILGIVFHVRRSYVAVVTMHAMFNAANLIITLSTSVQPRSGGG